MLVSVTRLRVRSWRYLPAFLIYALRSSRQASQADGNVGSDVLRDVNRTFWTRTVWRDEASMRTFMLAGAHRIAMPKLLDWCDEAAVVHWDQDRAELPEWAEAHRRLVSEGRRSKVHHPSPAHVAFAIGPPRA